LFFLGVPLYKFCSKFTGVPSWSRFTGPR